jgi:acetyltransferase-like isoleucine patch superfamily enzyme
MNDELNQKLTELYHHLATSDDGATRALRRLYKGVKNASIPAPKVIYQPLLWGYLAMRDTYAFGMRVFVAQPFFRAYTRKCGKNLRTGEFIHWVQGQGDIILGDNVWLDGKCTFTFAASYSERPTLEIGDGTGLGHDTEITVGKRVTIGKNCIISGSTRIFDSNGHSTDIFERRGLKAPSADEVRPVVIGNDVWMGKDCLVFPGVRIGDGAVISAGSVVRKHVPAYAVVAGNPAQVMFRLPRPILRPAASPGPLAQDDAPPP